MPLDELTSSLRYVKHLDKAVSPWLPDSEFSIIHSDLVSWRNSLPTSLDFTVDSIYLRLEGAQLGALALLHCTYHNAMCDLYRIAMPELFKLRNPLRFPPQQAGFLHHLQHQSIHHARSMAIVLVDTARYGARFLTDPSLPSLAYNANRVMLYYIARLLDMNRPDASAVVKDTIERVSDTNRMLQLMAKMNPLAGPLVCDRVLSDEYRVPLASPLELVTKRHLLVYNVRTMALEDSVWFSHG